MSCIYCTADCVYQSDGECRLSRAASPGTATNGGCAHFVKRYNKSKKRQPPLS